MNRMLKSQVILLASIILMVGCSFLPRTSGVLFAISSVCSFFLVMLIPGASLYLLLESRPKALNLFLYALLASPVLTTSISVLMMLSGSDSQSASIIVKAGAGGFAITSLLAKKHAGIDRSLTGRQWAVMAGVVALFCCIAGYLPLSHEWWRVRSDAWFHAAVVSQIDAFGIPPEDPYFAGLALQYMWFYHALIFTIAKSTGLDVFKAMPIVNLQMLAAFITATYLFSIRLRKERSSFGFGLSSVLVALLGLNALFWLFLPLKLARTFVGEVRGMEEIARTFSLSPFDMHTVRKFLRIYHNQVYFLDKFIVSTAFSLGLAYMAGFWYAATDLLSAKRSKQALVLVLISVIGMLTFHTAVGFIMLVGLFGGLLLLCFQKNSLEDFSLRPVSSLAVTAMAGLIICSPYLYSIMHIKETENVLPFGISIAKISGIVVSCALVIVLACAQLKKLIGIRTMQNRFLLLSTALITLFCLVVLLPGPNTYDKLPFFIFYPLSVVGAWTLVEISLRRNPGKERIVFAIALFSLLLLPVNLLATLGYYNTPTKQTLTSQEKEVAAWVKHHTPRDAVFIDSGDRVFLLVTGPRRYYWGTKAYSEFWGYNKKEMQKRRHVRDNLYASSDIDSLTLEALGSIENDVYIIVREENPVDSLKSEPEEKTAPAGMQKFSRYPDLFHLVLSGPIDVLKVDKAACMRRTADLKTLKGRSQKGDRR